MESSDLVGKMLQRVGSHVLSGVVGIAGAVALVAIGRAVGTSAFGADVPAWLKGTTLLAAVGTFLVAWFGGAYRYLRCPSCNGLVAWQVNQQASPVARRYDRKCRHCGATIFDDRLTRRVQLTLVACVVGTVAVLGAVLAFGPR
jgi:hypothetical protein